MQCLKEVHRCASYVIDIDVNYVNVNAVYFYFTPIPAEIYVKGIFYLLVEIEAVPLT